MSKTRTMPCPHKGRTNPGYLNILLNTVPLLLKKLFIAYNTNKILSWLRLSWHNIDRRRAFRERIM